MYISHSTSAATLFYAFFYVICTQDFLGSLELILRASGLGFNQKLELRMNIGMLVAKLG